jgi:tetratricopeptide (TPR) repeat protein
VAVDPAGGAVRTLVVVALLVGAAPLFAQPSAPAAFTAGRVAYAAGDYATAIAAFEEAFRADPRPELAFSLAQAHRNQYYADHDITHLHRALGLYRHYLVEAPSGPRVSHARLHEQTIETILASMPAIVATSPVAPPTQLLVTSEAPAARASIDGDAAATVPRLVEVTPGQHQVRVTADGHADSTVVALAVEQRLVVVATRLEPRAARLTVRVERGVRVEVDGDLVQGTRLVAPGSHRLTVTARGRRAEARTIELAAGSSRILELALAPTLQRRAARITLLGSMALAGTAAVAGGLAWRAQSAARAIPGPPDREIADLAVYRDAVARRDRWRGVGVGLGVTAGATALTGLALWYFDVTAAPEPTPALVPALGPESIGVAAVGSF